MNIPNIRQYKPRFSKHGFSAVVSGQEEDQDEAGRDPGSQREDNAQPCLHRKSAIITTRQFCGSMTF